MGDYINGVFCIRKCIAPPKKVAIIMRWLCYWGSHRAGFHCAKEGWRLYKQSVKNIFMQSFPPFLITAWENSQHFTRSQLVSLWNDVWEMRTKIPYWWPFSTQIWVVGLIGSKFASTKKKSTTRSGYWHVISTEFLHSFNRHHFAMKPVMASQNVTHFPRLFNDSTLFSWKPKLSAYM